MARKEWLAKRTTEKTLVKRTSRPRVTAETIKRMSRFIFYPIRSYYSKRAKKVVITRIVIANEVKQSHEFAAALRSLQ